jgi:hypothetical protein
LIHRLYLPRIHRLRIPPPRNELNTISLSAIEISSNLSTVKSIDRQHTQIFILNFERKALKINEIVKRPAHPAYRQAGRNQTDAD